MYLVIKELEMLLDECKCDWETDGEFAQQLRKAIKILKEHKE